MEGDQSECLIQIQIHDIVIFTLMLNICIIPFLTPVCVYDFLQILSYVRHILETDREVKVRQAALTVLKLLIKGLSQDAIQVSLHFIMLH